MSFLKFELISLHIFGSCIAANIERKAGKFNRSAFFAVHDDSRIARIIIGQSIEVIYPAFYTLQLLSFK